jgi:fatty acid desaturase
MMSIAHDHDHDHDSEEDLDHAPIDKPPREPGQPVKWYRTKLTREQLSELNCKSDLHGFAQTLGYLGTLALTGTAFVFACFYAPWYLAVAAFFVHGVCCNFLINGFHELVHDSVFRTRWLNGLFLRIFSFLGWYNHHHFWASHTEHHKFTLHPPDDLEVELPRKMTVGGFLAFAVVDPKGLRWTLQGMWRHAMGRVQGKWETHLFPEDKPRERREMFNWARLTIALHVTIGAAAIATGFWPVLLAVSLGRFVGTGIHYLCNEAQHAGLVDNVPDFRMCCRTIYLNPVLQFLYWHMNYHTEHHMYAGVPCYKLGKLHRMIRADLPDPPRGLLRTWRLIAAIMHRQKREPEYQYLPKLPATAQPGPVGNGG